MKRLVIIGAGGLGREVLQYINDINKVSLEYEVYGFIDANKALWDTRINGVPVIGDFTFLDSYNDKMYAICAVANPKVKKSLVEQGNKIGLEYVNIIHPLAYIASDKLGKGIIIGPYSVISVGVKIGDHVSINPQCGVGHDTSIDKFSTLYWNVNIGGFCNLGEEVEVGSKAFIKQNTSIENESIIGAGAVVTRNVREKCTVIGVPAREI